MQVTKVRKPEWIKVKAPMGDRFFQLKRLMRKKTLHTVCEEAKCPNISECWNGGTATFMILGDTCTRGCRFCAVKTKKTGLALDPFEPVKTAAAAVSMELDYVVLTSVDRDDLADQGAKHFANTILAIKKRDSRIKIESLIPDFRGDPSLINTVVEAKPDVMAHNIETVKRLTSHVRDPRASYQQSLNVLACIKSLDAGVYTKSSIMVGLGETLNEIKNTMKDLRQVGCDVLTLGQYLQPTKKHLRVETFVHPETFKRYQQIGEELGFLYVASGPLVRSSYRAGEFFLKGIIEKKSPKSEAP